MKEKINSVEEFFAKATIAQEANELVNSWWRNCEFIKELTNYIEDYENCTLVDLPNFYLEEPESVSLGVSVSPIRDVLYRKAYPWDKESIDTVSFSISVDYNDNNEYRDTRVHRTLNLWVPASLVSNFNKKDFDAWVVAKSLDRKKNIKNRIDELLALYPGLKKELMKEWKPAKKK